MFSYFCASFSCDSCIQTSSSFFVLFFLRITHFLTFKHQKQGHRWFESHSFVQLKKAYVISPNKDDLINSFYPMLCFSVCLCRGVFRTHPDIVLCSEYRTYQKSLFMNRLRCISLFSHSFIAPQKRFLRTFLLNTHSISPPFLMGGQLSVPNFEKGEGGVKKEKCLGGGLKEFLPWIFVWVGLLCFQSKKDF